MRISVVDAARDGSQPLLAPERGPEPEASPSHTEAARRAVGTPAPPVVPARAAEDSDTAWGDQPDSNDRRLLEDVPPHW